MIDEQHQNSNPSPTTNNTRIKNIMSDRLSMPLSKSLKFLINNESYSSSLKLSLSVSKSSS
jgi:hypothetical protein